MDRERCGTVASVQWQKQSWGAGLARVDSAGEVLARSSVGVVDNASKAIPQLLSQLVVTAGAQDDHGGLPK
jgi:hypothetical protein